MKLGNIRYFFAVACLVILFKSCTSNIEFTAFKTIKNSSWSADSTVVFSFNVTDTIVPKNMFINIRNTADYPFSNLYLITALQFPNAVEIVDTLQYKMTNNLGEFLGTGAASIKENKLFYREQKVFPLKGQYTLKIKHAMRKVDQVAPLKTLKGIQDVGVSIEKIK